MSTIITTIPTTFRARLSARISAANVSLVGATAAWSDARNARKTLGTLPDFVLADIGLTHGDIDQITR